MQLLRAWAEKPAGKIIAAVILVIALGVIVYTIPRLFGESAMGQSSRSRTFVCGETGQPFTYEIDLEDTIPVVSPHTGRRTGFPAEMCFWTADGSVKETPTPVVLNTWLEKSGPTFCPDCGRRVIANNPYPEDGAKPPPTEAEWRARSASQP